MLATFGNFSFQLASLEGASKTLLIVDVGDVLGHDYEVGVGKSFDEHCITHTMAHVAPGDTLKLYDAGRTKAMLGSVIVKEAVSLADSMPIPEEWASTQWATRVHPDALQLWQVRLFYYKINIWQ